MMRIARNGVALARLGNHIRSMKQRLSFSLLLFLSLFLVKGGPVPAVAATAHDFSFISIDGGDLPLADYKGKVVLLVNTASMCGFTRQYEGLQSLWSEYRDRGLVVLGVPSDDFGGQEFDTAKQVKSFCSLNYGIDFPMTDIVMVAGPNAHPYYKWVADVHGSLAIPRWNFHKHVIDADGKLVDWFASTTSPKSNRLRKAIETALKNRP
jgi:glutathione peroxidase